MQMESSSSGESLPTFVRWKVDHSTFGPDVQHAPTSQTSKPLGIFGLTHNELLESRWVQDDKLTIKVELERRVGYPEPVTRTPSPIKVPPANLSTCLGSLLDRESLSDVSFLVRGEKLKAHAVILCARSEVFHKQLTCGMAESVSREILIEDCDATTFKAFLKFLYTDDFADIEGLKGTELSIHSLLATSHKYEVTRLQLWCEQRMRQSISVEEVCGILRHAHLYGAKQLEQACMIFIKNNMASVAILPAFGALVQDWPEVSLKLNFFTAGLSASSTALALKGYESQKRPAEDEATDAKRPRH